MFAHEIARERKMFKEYNKRNFGLGYISSDTETYSTIILMYSLALWIKSKIYNSQMSFYFIYLYFISCSLYLIKIDKKIL